MMNGTDFVNAVKIAVQSGAQKGVVASLENPPGKRPDPELLSMSNWYKSLPAEDQTRIHHLVGMATRQTVYNFLLVLDGLLAIENTERKGEVLLQYEEDGRRIRLNDPRSEFLSTVFKNLE
jgi:hypothetical protein